MASFVKVDIKILQIFVLSGIALLLIVGVYRLRPTWAQIEVARARQEIEQLISADKLAPYEEIYDQVKSQDEADMVVTSLDRSSYIFFKGQVAFSGYYDLKKGIIKQEHYKEAPFSEDDKSRVRKWLEFIESHQIYGFDKNIDRGVRIYLKPNIYLLFFEQNVDQSYLNETLARGKDLRGDYFKRLTDRVIVATERR